MGGRGGVKGGKWDGHVPHQCKPNPSIMRLSGKLEWEEAREPLHADIDVGKGCGIGPGMAFAKEVMRMKRGKVVGLVPCAVGGSKIKEWRRGSYLYNELMRRANESVRDGGTIRALLWFQGESDTVTKQDAYAYKARMERFFKDIRSHLRIPSLLIIQVAITSGEGKLINKVREGQIEMKLPNVKCVDAKGLRLEADRLHLTTKSQVQLGIMLAHAYLRASS
ncbi:putative carbohydrate esterase [Senna tora]|uniref:Putative carbohydrate esterase n=1 Tax=Senna tora TaxID=362788 RepID=A0A834TXV2_9FABA|nr:putative carbohydrate esterase [Senna tora]